MIYGDSCSMDSKMPGYTNFSDDYSKKCNYLNKP